MKHIVCFLRLVALAGHILEHQRRQQVSSFFHACVTAQALLRALQLTERRTEVPRRSTLARYRRHYAAGQKPDQVSRLPHRRALRAGKKLPNLAAPRGRQST